MARIPTTEIEQLKSEVSVERLVEAAGIALTKSGKDKLGLCPFHADGEPSLVVSPAKNLWHCFACQIGGGPIDWVMKAKGVSFRHAVELLKADPTLAAVDVGGPVRSRVPSLPAPIAFDADDQALLNQCVDYYHETLQQSSEGLEYLASRGLAHPEVVAHFKLGFANRTLGLRLPSKNRKKGLSVRSHLEKIGVYRESGHEHFRGSLIVPVLDMAGDVVEVYGRKLRDNLRKGTPLHLYLPSECRAGGRGVWNLAGLVGVKEVILCEALIDGLTFWCAGFTNVTAAYGVEGFTEEHLVAFRQHGIERVLIAFDRDDAGERGAQNVAALLMSEGFECLRVHFPRGMDANSYALKMTPAQQSLGLVLRQAVWLGRGGASEDAPTPTPAPAQVIAPAPTLAPTYTLAPTSTHMSAPISTLAPAPACAQAHEPSPPFPSLAAGVVGARAKMALVGPTTASDPHGELLLALGGRHWRVRGWHKNVSLEQMRVNLQVRREFENGQEAFHVDTLDVYLARARAAFVKQAALELGAHESELKSDLGLLLLKLEALQDGHLRQQAKPQAQVKALSLEEEKAALGLLTAPDLVARIVVDMAACGVVGEANNLLAGYLAAVSRKLDTPLAILIQSSSAAGKSSLMDAVLAMVPEEEKMQYSAMTGQSLFYLGENDMQHKILAIAEEEGVRQAAYALKLLQSDGELTMASTGKDEASGELVTKQYKVRGPVMLMLTTTAIDVDEELMNRCLVLTVNESREQTRAIHERQRSKQTLAGLLAANDKQRITALHQNAQRLLKPMLVVNPFADQLTFLDDKTRMRRDHMKYLTLIKAITLLHQHQREVKTVEHGGQSLAYIEASKADIALANQIAHEVLGRTLDELPPQTRNLLTLLQTWVVERASAEGLAPRECRFRRKEVRDVLRWGDTQLKLHLARLVELEYLMVHRRGTTFEYELVYDGKKEGGSHLCGLLDVNQLMYDGERSGVNGNQSDLSLDQSGRGRPNVGPRSGAGRGTKNADFSYENAEILEKNGKTHVYEKSENHTPVISIKS